MQNLYQPFYKASSTKDRGTLSELRNSVFIELMSRDQTELLKATGKPKRYYMYLYCKIWNLFFLIKLWSCSFEYLISNLLLVHVLISKKSVCIQHHEFKFQIKDFCHNKYTKCQLHVHVVLFNFRWISSCFIDSSSFK